MIIRFIRGSMYVLFLLRGMMEVAMPSSIYWKEKIGGINIYVNNLHNQPQI